MDSRILVIFRHEGPATTIMLNTESSFQDFKTKLANAGVGDVYINASMISKTDKHDECILSTNEHWTNLLFLMKISGTEVLTISSVNFKQPSIVNHDVPIPPLGQNNTLNSDSCTDSRTPLSGIGSTPRQEENVPHINLPIVEDKVLLTAPWANYIKGEGQAFKGGVQQFRTQLSKFMLEKGYKYDFVCNTDKQVMARCAYRVSHGCNWYINATYAKANNWFYIQTYISEHRCPMNVRATYRLTAKMMGALIVDKVKKKPSIKPNEVIDLFKEEYGLNVTYQQAFRGIECAQDLIYGCHEASYNELKWYLHYLLKMNHGSRIVFEEAHVMVNGVLKNRFIRSFVAFGACIDGFNHCRPMLFIDGTHLSGRYGGVLLSATAKDGDNGLFPIAFAIVDVENKDNWRWFLLNLLTVIPFDRKHLKRNLTTKLAGRALKLVEKQKFIELFSDAARAPTQRIFDETFAEYKVAGGRKAVEFTENMPLEKWAFSHAPCARFGEMTSNAVESYNKWIVDARALPIIQCVDKIRAQTMELLYRRRTAAEKWPSGTLCGEKQKEWNRVCQSSRHWNVRRATEHVFEFLLEPTVVVRLDERICDCYGWQFHGYPCVHAIAAIDMSSHSLDKYIDPYYFADTYKATYRGAIMPIATILKLTDIDNDWPKVFPPHKLRQSGRPQKKRIISNGEHASFKKRSYRCKKCKQYGHRADKCKQPLP